MFFNNCPCKYKNYDECVDYNNYYTKSQKPKCNCPYLKPNNQHNCPMNMPFYPKGNSEYKFCIEGTIKIKNNGCLW